MLIYNKGKRSFLSLPLTNGNKADLKPDSQLDIDKKKAVWLLDNYPGELIGK